jgi:hypothetical protein
MTDMTMTNAPTGNQATMSEPAFTRPKPATTSVITLEQLATEMKVTPRDARMLLRLAAKQAKQYPNLGKEHVARQPWQWTPGSKALDEARRALKATD